MTSSNNGARQHTQPGRQGAARTRSFVLLLIGMLAVPAAGTPAPVRLTLTLTKRAITVGKTKGSPVLFQPDRNVRRASYITYVFSNKEFRAKVGDPGRVDRIKIEVEILSTRERRHVPAQGQMPDGGFRMIEHRCRILRVVR